MVAFVSGSHGFIGSHLVKRLEQMEWKVVRLDRTGNLPSDKVDYIFDLASYGNLYHQTDESEILRANVVRIIEMLQKVKRVKGIVLTSSSSVLLPVKTAYSMAKEAVELIPQAFNLPIVVARPSTIIGRGEPETHLIPMLISGKIKDFVPEPTHDFLSVHDYVEAIILMARNANKLKGKTLNVSSGVSTSNQKIKEIVEELKGKEIKVNMVKSLRDYDTREWKVQPALELYELGWKVEVKLKDAIKEML